MTSERAQVGAACWKGQLYAVGGTVGEAYTIALGCVEKLDLKHCKDQSKRKSIDGKPLHRWTRLLAQMNTPRFSHGVACSREGKLYAAGGMDTHFSVRAASRYWTCAKSQMLGGNR